MRMTQPGYPRKQGLYDPRYEHDACGIGFVVNIKGEKSHEIVQQALTVLQNLDHRGACGCEDNTGDGAGILLQIPHAFLQHACEGIGLQLPKPGHYGVGMVFLPPDRAQRHHCEQRFEAIVRQEGQEVLGWRSVPTDNLYLGETAKSREPVDRKSTRLNSSHLGISYAVFSYHRQLHSFPTRRSSDLYSCRSQGIMGWAWCSCRLTARSGITVNSALRPLCARKDKRCWAGAASLPTICTWVRRPSRVSR